MKPIFASNLTPSAFYYFALFNGDALAYRNDLSAGDANKFEAFGTTTRDKYAVGIAAADASGYYAAAMPDDLPAGILPYRVRLYARAGGTPSAGADGNPVGSGELAFNGTTRLEVTLADIAYQTALIGSVTSGDDPSLGQNVFDPIEAQTAIYWLQSFMRAGYVTTGWTRFAFTVKANKSTDDDDAALITVRVSNPASAGTDGVLTFNRRPVASGDALRGKGALVITETNPDTLVSVTLWPEALALPPSPDNEPYSFELDYWDASNVKHQVGSGEFVLSRSVRRSVSAP